MHYGRLEDKKPILKKLFNERQLALSQAGLKMDAVEDLMKYYK